MVDPMPAVYLEADRQIKLLSPLYVVALKEEASPQTSYSKEVDDSSNLADRSAEFDPGQY